MHTITPFKTTSPEYLGWLSGHKLNKTNNSALPEHGNREDMTIENLYEYRRWGQSMLDETLKKLECLQIEHPNYRNSLVSDYYQLKIWCETFDSLSACLNWNESHVIYQDGLIKLKKHVNKL